MKTAEQMRPSILIVDDNPKNLEVLGKLLQVEKYKIEFAVNGKAALEWLELSQFDLILLDVNLPKKNGHEVLKYIKTSDHLKQIPVIMLTTSSSDKDVLLSYKNHANCFITKPLDVNNFLTIISGIENFWMNIVKLPKNKKS